VLEGLGQEIDGLRHLITELRPAALDDFGLVPALEALARRAQAMDGLEISTDIGLPDDARRLDPELESTIYRVVQEALTNVSRHAKATQATISIVEENDSVTAAVTDNGEGLPEGGASRQRTPEQELKGGFGVSGMRERAELVGGEIELVSAPGGGATMRLTVPLAGRPTPV
jgi:signal transduction histidine kinase